MKSRITWFFVGCLLTVVTDRSVMMVRAATQGEIVSACADKRTGLMRYVSAGKCKTTERAIAWNVRGNTGATGEKGDQGLQGPRGLTGDAGPAGRDGASASQGATGPTGPTGPAGATGPTGPTGPAGATGPTGATGPVGATGPQGPGAISYLSASATRSGNSAGTYTSLYSNSEGIELDLSCFNVVSGGVEFSLRAKAPSGSFITGWVNEAASSAVLGATGTADGTLREVSTYGSSLPKRNSGNWRFEFVGPSITPTYVFLNIANSTNCLIKGYSQTG